MQEAIVVVIVVQLPMQSVLITTNVVSSNTALGGMYSIQQTYSAGVDPGFKVRGGALKIKKKKFLGYFV